MNDIFRYQVMLERATNAGNPNREKTLDAWQRRTITTRAALLKIKEDYEAELQKLRETYTPKVFEEKRRQPDQDYAALRALAVNKATEDLKSVLASKRAQFDRSSGAPTEEDLRLLEALNMRTSLNAAEIAAVSGKFNGNVQAIRVLRDIAQKHNISFPDVGDPEQFEDMLERAEQFSLDHLREIDTDRGQLNYKGVLFWENPGEGETDYFYGTLDGQGFTTEQIEEASKPDSAVTKTPSDSAEAARAANSQTGEMWAEVRANGQQSLHTIAAQFHVTAEQIRQANPGKDLDRIYSGDRILVPSTQFSFQPDPSGCHVQPQDVKAVPRPVYTDPTGPSGEAIGEDISIK